MSKKSYLEDSIDTFIAKKLQSKNPAAKYAKYLFDPQGFIENELGFELYEWQKKVCDHIASEFKKNANKKHFVCRVAVAGGNGTGKTKLGYALIQWRFLSQPGVVQLLLSNSVFQTMRTGFLDLSESLKKLVERGLCNVDNKCFFGVKGANEVIETLSDWYTHYLTQAVTVSGLSGMHKPFMTFFFDEATEFEGRVWQALENMSTQGQILMYCVGNPVASENYFANVFLKRDEGKKTGWYAINVSLLDLPASARNQEVIDECIESYGKDSPRARSMIYGLFPHDLDTHRFSRNIIIKATQRK